MKKRLLIGIVVILLGCTALVLIYPNVLFILLGQVRHEASFDGKPTNYWARAIKHEGFLTQGPPAGDIGKVLRDGGAAAVPVLAELAENPDENVRFEALTSLSLIGSGARSAIPVLTTLVKTETSSSRFMLASDTLSKADPKLAATTFGEIIRDEQDQARRSWALTELLKLGPESQPALDSLNKLLNNPEQDERLRVQAVEVLWALRQPAEPLVKELCAIASNEKSTAGVQALWALGEMGPAGKSGLPTLLELLQKPSLPPTGNKWGPAHRAAVIRALGRLGPESAPAVPALITLLKGSQRNLYREVAQALSEIGPAAKPAAPVIVQMLEGMKKPQKIGWDALTLSTLREALQKIDPEAATRAGIQ